MLVAVACCAVALTVGVLVHRSTLARSLNDGRAKAVTQLSRDLQDHERDATPPDSLRMSPGAMPVELLRRLRGPQGLRDGYATWYDGDGPGDHPSMWAAQTYQGSPVAVEIDMTPDLLTRRALDRHMWKYSLVALAVVVPLSALAAELPNRRLRRVARTARRITAGDLAARTGAGRGSDEIAEISATVDSMADSLLGRLLAEQHFTADVAHELRTPLMGLVTASGLLPEGEATDLVRDRVGVLRTLVENLLEISRLDAGAEQADTQPVPLGELVDGISTAHRAADTAHHVRHPDRPDRPASARQDRHQSGRQRPPARSRTRRGRRGGDLRYRTGPRPGLPPPAARRRTPAVPHRHIRTRPRPRPRADHRARPGPGHRGVAVLRQRARRRGRRHAPSPACRLTRLTTARLNGGGLSPVSRAARCRAKSSMPCSWPVPGTGNWRRHS